MWNNLRETISYLSLTLGPIVLIVAVVFGFLLKIHGTGLKQQKDIVTIHYGDGEILAVQRTCVEYATYIASMDIVIDPSFDYCQQPVQYQVIPPPYKIITSKGALN